MTLCNESAVYRYTWAGRDESFICEAHAAQLRGIAETMGYHCQLIPIEPGNETCKQHIKEI